MGSHELSSLKFGIGTGQHLLLKSVHSGHEHSWLFVPVNTRVYEKVLSLSSQAIEIFEQLILFFQKLIFSL